MIAHMTDTMTHSALPDPTLHPGYYAGVSLKRLAAWAIDIIVIFAATVVVATLPLFIGWFFFPILFLMISFAYRSLTIGAKSATWGMRLFNIELRRNTDAQPLDRGEAVLHTLGYMLATSFVMPQILSAVLMLLQDRGRGLHDMLTGVTMINRPSRF